MIILQAERGSGVCGGGAKKRSLPLRIILSNSLLRNLKGKLPSESDGRIQRQFYTSKSYGKDTKVK